jgi:hypothetical protein
VKAGKAGGRLEPEKKAGTPTRKAGRNGRLGHPPMGRLGHQAKAGTPTRRNEGWDTHAKKAGKNEGWDTHAKKAGRRLGHPKKAGTPTHGGRL